MKEDFKIKGLFYELNDFKLRKYLNIVRKSSNKENPNSMVLIDLHDNIFNRFGEGRGALVASPHDI